MSTKKETIIMVLFFSIIAISFLAIFIILPFKNGGSTTNYYTTTTTNNEIQKTTTSSPSTTTPSTPTEEKDNTGLFGWIDFWSPPEDEEDEVLIVQTTPGLIIPIVPKEEETPSDEGLFNWIGNAFDNKEDEVLVVQTIPGVSIPIVPEQETTDDTPLIDTNVGAFDWFTNIFVATPSQDDLVDTPNIYVPIIPETTSTPLPAYQCFDSDSTEDDAMVKGTCKDASGSHVDSCSSRGNTLTEYYCRSGSCVSRAVTCGYCLDGACQYPQ